MEHGSDAGLCDLARALEVLCPIFVNYTREIIPTSLDCYEIKQTRPGANKVFININNNNNLDRIF